MDPELNQLLKDLEGVVVSSPVHLFGWCLLDEERFFVRMLRLQESLQGNNKTPPASHENGKEGQAIGLERLLNELEQLVENGTMHLFGKTVIDEEKFFVQTSKLRNAIPEYFTRADRVTCHSENSLLNARQHTRSTVTEAEREAERILEKDLEPLVMNSPVHLFGWCLLDERKFFTQTSRLREALQENSETPVTDVENGKEG